MSEQAIPAELMQAAIGAVCEGLHSSGKQSLEGFSLPVARALLAERQKATEAEQARCENIARFYTYTKTFDAHSNGAVACNASQNIADMILGRIPFDVEPEVA